MIKKIFNKASCGWALFILLMLYLMSALAGFFSPYQYDEDDLDYIWAPPTKIKIVDFRQGVAAPFLYGIRYNVNEYYQRVYTQDKDDVHLIKFFVRGFKYKILGLIPCDIHLFGAQGEKLFLLGADSQGRDIFSRILYGGQVSLSIGLLGACLSVLIGVFIGGISGYTGGAVDNILMRLCEVMMMAPAFYLILALRSSFGPNLDSAQIYLLIVVILSVIGWASTARIVRGMAISLRENDFIAAARVAGLSDFKIIYRHILPHTFSYALTAVCLSVPGYILGEAALSMLGLGIQEPMASWGNLLSMAMGVVNIRFYPWVLFPGIFILVTVMCFNVLGSGLREALDPRGAD